MSRTQRILLALAISDCAREFTKENIRRDQPAWSETEVFHEWLKVAFSPEPIPRWIDERPRS